MSLIVRLRTSPQRRLAICGIWKGKVVNVSTLTLELPDELIALIGSQQILESRVRQALVIDLLREAELSLGQAARLLSMTRGEMLDLMAHHRIPTGPESPKELKQELDAAREALRFAATDARSQR